MDAERAAIVDARVGWAVIGVTTTLWMAHLVGMAVLAEGGCAGAGAWVLHGLTLVLFAPTAALTWLAWRRRRGSEAQVFLADFAVWVGATNAFIIVVEWVPILQLSACGS